MDLQTKGQDTDAQEMGNKSAKTRHYDENFLKPEAQIFCENPQKSPNKFSDFWSTSGNNKVSTPKLPAAPHSSPVDALQEPNNFRLSDSLKSESFRTLLNQLSDGKDLKKVVKDATELPFTDSVSDMNTLDYPAPPSVKAKKNIFFTSSPESNRNVISNGFPQYEYFDLEASLGAVSLNMDYGSPCNDGISVLAQRSSEISDISSTETEESFSDVENLTLDSQSFQSMPTRWEVHSPKRPLSAVSKFLRKRKLLKQRDRFSSVDTISKPTLIGELDTCNAAFLQTV